MKPAPFGYARPNTLTGALEQLAAQPEAKPLAGGQSLIPAMNFRLAAPASLIDLNGITELAGVSELPGGGLSLGAMTRHSAVERDARVRQRAPLLAEAMPYIAHPAIRNRGTIGGSLAHADPAAELPAVMVALEATLVLRSRSGERRVAAADFFTGLFATTLEPGELIVAVEIPPLAPRTGWAFEEFARRHGDYALAGVAALVTLNGQGRCERARVVLLSVGDGPVTATNAVSMLDGSDLGEAVIREAAERAGQDDIDPPADIHAPAAFRRRLVRVLTRRALLRAVSRAGAGS
ncbi:MAG: FAD binding domain-containing protein [Gemmatimonadales bacterium]